VPKFAAIMAFIRLLMQPFSSFFHYWQIMIAGLIVASVIIGALGALMQQHLRRLLAYSSIGHIGFVCLGFMAGEASAIISIVLYMIIYMITLVGIFATLLQLHARGHGIELMEDLAGLNHSYPYHAFILATLLFSLAGIPPLAGFWVKFYILQSAVAAGWYGLSITVVLAGVVSAFYYLRLIKVMYFDGAVDTSLNVSGQLSNKVIMTLSAVTSLGFAILLGGSVTWVTPAIQSIATGW
jgi:NADH-quinone oxidoreductase subunit N